MSRCSPRTSTRWPIHLMLTDLVMPGMDGRRLTEELAMTREDIPVIYMSGYPSPAHPFEHADPPTLLEKPFAPRTLLRTVRTAIEAAAARQDQPEPPTTVPVVDAEVADDDNDPQ